MHIATQIKISNLGKIASILFLLIATMLIGRSIASGSYVYFLFLLFVGGVLLLYLKQVEFFILLVLILNQEFFNLVPREILGGRYFQDILYILVFLTGAWYFFRKREHEEANFSIMIFSFLLLVVVAVFNSCLQGQSVMLGLKAARGNFLILFYFVFMARSINMTKLFRLIIITGFLLILLNNIQYIFFGEIKLFHYSLEELRVERAGQMRFLLGDFFTIFSPIIALGEYLRTKKKIFLVASIYMFSIVIIQGLTRAVIWGFIATIFLLLFYAKRINFSKTVGIGIPVVALLIWLGPVIQSTVFWELFETTKYEFTEQAGNIGVRFDSYEYYIGEIAKSPIIGRGIWNDAYEGHNPEDMKHKDIHLGDIGITGHIFHWGLLGAVWLIVIFAKIYKTAFVSIGRLKEHIHYGIIGYFIFSIVTMATLNSFTSRRTIVYLALSLALLCQSKFFKKDAQIE